MAEHTIKVRCFAVAEKYRKPYFTSTALPFYYGKLLIVCYLLTNHYHFLDITLVQSIMMCRVSCTYASATALTASKSKKKVKQSSS